MPSRIAELPRGAHVFVDEIKAKGYIMVATWVPSSEVAGTRRSVRGLCRPNQNRLHFRKMTDSDRRRAITRITAMDVAVVVYRTPIKDAQAARTELLRLILLDAIATSARRFVIERDEASVASDQRIAASVLPHREVVAHLRSVEEPLLCISDAVAWCLNRGGYWARAVESVVRATHTASHTKEPG